MAYLIVESGSNQGQQLGTVPGYIAAMHDTGIVQTGRDIDWKR